MINQRLEKKVRQDAAKLKKDQSTLEGDRAVRFGRFEANVSKATEELTTWVEDSVSQLVEGFEKLTDEAKETVVSSVAGVKKDFGRGLSHYNAKAQEIADKVPGDFGYKVARYPWVVISIAWLLVSSWVAYSNHLGNLLGSNKFEYILFFGRKTMNKDIFEGKWKQIRGESKAWWGKLTDDDLDRAAGKFDVLAGLLQEKYCYTRQRAAEEIDKRVTEYEASLKK